MIVSLQLRFGSSTLSILWPSNAVIVVALLLSPKKHWWLYLLAVAPVHILALGTVHVGYWWPTYQIVHNTVLTVAIATILLNFEPKVLRFERLREVLIFLGVAVFVPGIVSLLATFPMISLAPEAFLLQHGWGGGFWVIWGGRWLTNTVSILVFVPFILLGITNGADFFRGISRSRYIEGGVLALTLIFVNFVTFGAIQTSTQIQHALFLAPLPLLLWAAVRFGSTGASWSIADTGVYFHLV